MLDSEYVILNKPSTENDTFDDYDLITQQHIVSYTSNFADW